MQMEGWKWKGKNLFIKLCFLKPALWRSSLRRHDKFRCLSSWQVTRWSLQIRNLCIIFHSFHREISCPGFIYFFKSEMQTKETQPTSYLHMNLIVNGLLYQNFERVSAWFYHFIYQLFLICQWNPLQCQIFLVLVTYWEIL